MKIVKVTVLKNDNEIIDAIVEYDNYRVNRCYKTNRVNDVLEDFCKQENKTIQELYAMNIIKDISCSQDKRKLINSSINAINNYSKKTKKEEIINLLNSAMTIILGLSHNNIIYGIYIKNLALVPLVSISTLLCDSFYKSGMYNMIDSHKLKAQKRKRMALRVWSTFLLSINLLTLFKEDISYTLNNSYNKKIISTDLNDLNRENLSNYSLRYIQIEKIFSDLEQNPYLKVKDIEILMELKEYCNNNIYIDLDEFYDRLMTCRIFDYYSFNNTSSGHYEELSNKIRVFDDIQEDENLDRRSVILHEGIHMLGDFSHTFLNEGMASLIEHEYYEDESYFGIDNYFYERQCVRALCYLVGADTMLQAYTEKNQELLDYKLLEIYGTKEKVNQIYEYMNQYVSRECESKILYKALCDGNLTLEQKEEIPAYIYIDGITTNINFDKLFNKSENVKTLKY